MSSDSLEEVFVKLYLRFALKFTLRIQLRIVSLPHSIITFIHAEVIYVLVWEKKCHLKFKLILTFLLPQARYVCSAADKDIDGILCDFL